MVNRCDTKRNSFEIDFSFVFRLCFRCKVLKLHKAKIGKKAFYCFEMVGIVARKSSTLNFVTC